MGKPITPEEWSKAKLGDEDVIEKIVLQYYRLAYSVAYKWIRKGMIPYDEAISAAHLSLLKCIRGNYDPEKAEFTTYLVRAVDNEMRMYLRRNKKTQQLVSLDKEIQFDEGYAVYGDTLEDIEQNAIEEVEERITLGYIEEAVFVALQRMKANERFCFVLWLQGLTHTRVAETVGISQSYASRLIGAAIKKIRQVAEDMEVC